MKHIIISLAFALAALHTWAGDDLEIKLVSPGVADVDVTHIRATIEGDSLTLYYTYVFTRTSVSTRRAIVLTPCLSGEEELVMLPQVGIYGRQLYHYYRRNNNPYMLGESNETVLRAKHLPDTLACQSTFAYRDWMSQGRFSLSCQTYGCCNDITSEADALLATIETTEYVPTFAYVRPTDKDRTVKMRSVSGSAWICFPVNKSDIQRNYKGNAAELDKMHATISSVADDPDVSITSLTLKGYASPEGSYDSNAQLAQGRTKAVADYIVSHYGIRRDVIAMSSEPENWEGLRNYVEESDLKNRDAILDIIDQNVEPDKKEWRIKSRYPDDYRHLLAECYPLLRRTDYEVAYIVRHYSDPAEIRALITTNPGKLSLEEYYVAAQDLEPGSEEFSQVYDAAVRQYPDDPAANLNAANAAMARGDLDAAATYLEKAGDSQEANYARTVYAALSGDREAARQLKNAGRTSDND